MRPFVFFGGKGGVGKTTVSAAYALQCARAGVRTLIVSTDPAHSVSDVFEQSFDDEPRAVEGHDGLFAMELDPEEEVERHLQETRRAMADQVSPSVVNAIDRQVELAHQTPGAHESALFDRFIDVMREVREGGEGDVAELGVDRVVFDTSPTGGTLRLLSLPSFLGDWIDRLIRKRTKSIDLFEKAAIGDREARYKVDTDPIVARLRERKERFEFAGRVLREEAAFFLVLNPDDLSIRETRRAVDSLAEHGLRVDGLVVNRMTPEPEPHEEGRGARFLRERCALERERLERIRETFEEPVVAVIETRVGEVKGDLLAEVAAELDVETTAATEP